MKKAKQKIVNNNDQLNKKFKFRYVFYLILAIVFSLAVYSYTPSDTSRTTSSVDMHNYIGILGAYIAAASFYIIGLATYLFALLLILWGIRSCVINPPSERKFYFSGVFLAVFGLALLFAINPEPFLSMTVKLNLGQYENPARSIPGGAIGQFLVAPGIDEFKPGFLRRFIGYVGSNILGWVMMMAGFLIIYLSDWHMILKKALLESHNDYQKDVNNKEKSSAIRDALASLKEKQQKITTMLTHDNYQKEEPSPKVTPEAKENTAIIDTFFPELEEQNTQMEAIKKFANEPIVEQKVAPKAPNAQIAINKETSLNGSASASPLNDASPNTEITVQGANAKATVHSAFACPNLNMLSMGKGAVGEDLVHINKAKKALQATLDSFNIRGIVSDHISGPRVTRYEIILEPGVKVDKVSSLNNNIAMSLEAKSIRILAPIPGKNAVGVEAPNATSEAVFMRSIMESEVWQNSDAEIPIVLGKDVAGVPVVLDLAKAPHLLIAGSTGSGKSVCMNTLIMSMLFKFSPDELRLITVDPKVVELKDYEKLPHLVTPVINDSKKVPIALRWAVNEMERRYQILAKVGVKNLRGFNNRVINSVHLDEDGNEIPAKLPILVIIIDELADLMMTDAKVDVEYAISRIAAKGRAAGLHIVVATQRPSTTVITGVIKANLPTRIAFRVGSQIDSRVILDKKGGETLLGKGDMLFLPPGGAELVRIQGAMVDDADIKKVVDFIAMQRPQNFDKGVVAEEAEEEVALNTKEGRTELDDAMDDIIADEYAPIIAKYIQPGDSDLVKKSLEIILSSRQASTSYLQRRLKIGYNKAAEIIDMLETRGIVGPPGPGGSKRQILVFDEIEG